MLDNALSILLRQIILDGLEQSEIEGVAVKQGYQPTQQGKESGKCVQFFKISDHNHGSPARIDRWDQDNSVMIRETRQTVETTIQISAMAPRDPSDLNAMTASDLAQMVAMILQDEDAIKRFADNKIGILRITDVRNPSFRDETDQWAFDPAFDITLSYDRAITRETPTIETVEYNLIKV